MQTKMKSMKLSPAEKEKSMPVATGKMDGPQYPWGLRITLDNDVLEKLGISLPRVGEKIRIDAIAEVKSVHASESEDKKKYASCELQITDIALDDGGGVSAETFYKKA